MPFDDPQIFQLVQQESARTGIHPGILLAMIKQESGGNLRAVGGAGEQGLMQVKPTTKPGVNLFDPAANVAAGADYLRENLDRFGDDARLALSGYNQGPTANLRPAGSTPVPGRTSTRSSRTPCRWVRTTSASAPSCSRSIRRSSPDYSGRRRCPPRNSRFIAAPASPCARQ